MAARKYSKKKTSKRRSVKTKRTGGALTSKAAVLRTAYARAVLNPRTGPLVGVPQFVPIATHVVRTRAIGDFQSHGGKFSLLFNPMAMVANDRRAIQVFQGNGAVLDLATDADDPQPPTAEFDLDPESDNFNGGQCMYAFKSNVDYGAAQFAGSGDVASEGLKARVVGAVIRLCNTSNSHLRDGVFTALHDRHHHSLEDSTTTKMAAQNNSIIKPAGDGSWIGLLYRAVRPQEIEDWQTEAGILPGDKLAGGDQTGDGDYDDMNPGYMRINWTGSGSSIDDNQSFHVEAYAIVEYAGESVTTLVKHTNKGSGAATASETGEVNDGARAAEAAGRGTEHEHVDIEDRIEHLKQTIESHVESAHEEFGDPHASRVIGSSAGAAWMKWARDQPPTDKSVHDLASLESAEVSNLAYVAHDSGANVEAMQDVLANAPDHLSHMRDWKVKYIGNGDKDIILHDPVSGRFHVGYAGTTGANTGDSAMQWMVNNPSMQAGFELTPRAKGAQRTADKAVQMAAGDLTKVKLHGHSQGGALAIRNAQRTGISAHVQNPCFPAKDILADTRTAVRIDRVSSDVISMPSVFGDKATLENLPVTSAGKVSVETVGIKGGYAKAWEITRPKTTSTAYNSHSLENFRYTNDEVIGVGAKGVQVARYSKFASVSKVLGEVYTGALVIGDAIEDAKAVRHENFAAVKGTAMFATDVAAELGDVAIVSGAAAEGAAVGAAVGEAIGVAVGPIGMLVAGAVGGFIGAEATTIVDDARKHIKHWIKNWFH